MNRMGAIGSGQKCAEQRPMYRPMLPHRACVSRTRQPDGSRNPVAPVLDVAIFRYDDITRAEESLHSLAIAFCVSGRRRARPGAQPSTGWPSCF